jgi:hypothetical protein
MFLTGTEPNKFLLLFFLHFLAWIRELVLNPPESEYTSTFLPKKISDKVGGGEGGRHTGKELPLNTTVGHFKGKQTNALVSE